MYIEADLLYAYLKPSDWLKEHAVRIIGKAGLITSVISVTEIEFVAKRDFGDEFANSVLSQIENIENLKIVPLSIEILRKAVEYRKKFGLNIFDAIHAATTFVWNQDIVSTDRIFDLIGEIKRVEPKELAGLRD